LPYSASARAQAVRATGDIEKGMHDRVLTIDAVIVATSGA
jgi:hypothetical protein